MVCGVVWMWCGSGGIGQGMEAMGVSQGVEKIKVAPVVKGEKVQRHRGMVGWRVKVWVWRYGWVEGRGSEGCGED